VTRGYQLGWRVGGGGAIALAATPNRWPCGALVVPTSYSEPHKQGLGTGYGEVALGRVLTPRLGRDMASQPCIGGLRIKPHAPPLVQAPVNSFEFQPCGRTPQALVAGRLLLQQPKPFQSATTSSKI
jgi:hypothetical protein